MGAVGPTRKRTPYGFQNTEKIVNYVCLRNRKLEKPLSSGGPFVDTNTKLVKDGIRNTQLVDDDLNSW